MASIVSAGTTSGTSLNLSADTSGVLQLATNGTTTAVTIDTSQNVGIGTTSPSSFAGKLVVNGGVSLLNSNRLYLWSPSNGFAPAIYAPSESIAFTDNNGVETFRVGSTGVLTLKGGNNAASGVGITFPATQSASSDANTLDDYEEGTWTPTVTTGTVGTQTCNYTKIGRQVTVWGRLFSFSNRSAGSDVTINNLPFTSGSNSSTGAHGNSLAQFISNMNGLTTYVNSSGTSLIFYDVRSGGFRSLFHSDLNSASAEIYFFATYQTAN